MKTIKLSLVALATVLTMGAAAQVGIQAGYSSESQKTTGTILGLFLISKFRILRDGCSDERLQ